jgi:hypothetical protein
MDAKVKRMRNIVIACIVLSFSAGVFVPFRAIVWHVSHSSAVDVGQYELRLPLWWWRPDSESNDVTILHATVFQGSSGDIRIFPSNDLALRGEPLDGLQWQEAFLQMLHDGRKSFTPVVIDSPDVSLFCVDKTDIPGSRLLICRIPGVAWGISFSGNASDEQKAEVVLKTLRLRN